MVSMQFEGGAPHPGPRSNRKMQLEGKFALTPAPLPPGEREPFGRLWTAVPPYRLLTQVRRGANGRNATQFTVPLWSPGEWLNRSGQGEGNSRRVFSRGEKLERKSLL